LIDHFGKSFACCKLKSGDKIAVNRIKSNGTVEEQYPPENCDLLAWFLVG